MSEPRANEARRSQGQGALGGYAVPDGSARCWTGPPVSRQLALRFPHTENSPGETELSTLAHEPPPSWRPGSTSLAGWLPGLPRSRHESLRRAHALCDSRVIDNLRSFLNGNFN